MKDGGISMMYLTNFVVCSSSTGDKIISEKLQKKILWRKQRIFLSNNKSDFDNKVLVKFELYRFYKT